DDDVIDTPIYLSLLRGFRNNLKELEEIWWAKHLQKLGMKDGRVKDCLQIIWTRVSSIEHHGHVTTSSKTGVCDASNLSFM
ncbi:unnamed protein product, partial [Sphenostylis stenocarpa]